MSFKLVPDRLLAKSFKPGQWKGSYSLVGHTADVVNAVTILVDTLGDRLIQQFDLDCELSHLKATARLAAYLHDWGKANHHFQGVVRAELPNANPKRYVIKQPQMLRHEVVSILLAWEFKEWLEQALGDFYTAIAATGGHHLKLGGEKGKESDNLGEIHASGDVELYLYTVETINGKLAYNPHFRELLHYGEKCLNLPKFTPIPKKIINLMSKTKIEEKQGEIREYLAIEWEPNKNFTAVIKALLIAADSIGSALPTTGLSTQQRKQWIEDNLNKTLDEVKLNQVIQTRLAGHELLPFQQDLGTSSNRVTIARAGCGTGKTLGAYNWAKKHALGRKLFFCYPTTGTSTEGFIDYVHGQVEAELFHSRATVDLERILSTGEESDLDDSGEVAIKLDSFRAWSAEAIVCTVDTVLGLFQCNRRPLYCFPAIANAAFVFDEIHCYDSQLFTTLLRFLKVVKAPTLLMSASILPWQKAAIEEALGEPITLIEGPKDLENLPRYRFTLSETPDWQRVEQEFNSEGKVLWVCNQVNTAIAVYREAKQRGLNALLYHSRYRYQDRVDHHRAVVDAFKPDYTEPVIAITTQVAEMSLDLSATLLVSQIADSPGLIQRLGRLNRRYCGHSLEALFYSDKNIGFPYTAQQLRAGKMMIESFTGEVNQTQLANWLEQSNEISGLDQDLSMTWLDGQWRTYQASLRQAGHNLTVLLEEDLPIIEQSSAKEIPRFTVPIPIPSIKQKATWAKYKFYTVAPANVWGYSQEFGAEDLTWR